MGKVVVVWSSILQARARRHLDSYRASAWSRENRCDYPQRWNSRSLPF